MSTNTKSKKLNFKGLRDQLRFTKINVIDSAKDGEGEVKKKPKNDNLTSSLSSKKKQGVIKSMFASTEADIIKTRFLTSTLAYVDDSTGELFNSVQILYSSTSNKLFEKLIYHIQEGLVKTQLIKIVNAKTHEVKFFKMSFNKDIAARLKDDPTIDSFINEIILKSDRLSDLIESDTVIKVVKLNAPAVNADYGRYSLILSIC